MSLLHKALKKAEREEGAGGNSGAMVDVENTPAGTSLRTYLLASVAVTLLLGTIYFRVLKKPEASPPVPAIRTAAGIAEGASARQLMDEAKKQFELGQLEDAKAQFEKAVLLEPRNVEAYNNLGLVLKKMGRSEEAFEQYRKALAIDPQCVECLNNLGALYLVTHDLAEAEANFQKAIQEKPDYADPYFHLGILLEARGDVAGARRNYQKFLELAKGISADFLLQIQERMAAAPPS